MQGVKDFSMYEYALEAIGSSVEDLGEVSNISRKDYEERTTFRCLTNVPPLEYISLLIEMAILLRTNRAGRVYVGFERLSHMEPIADRFLRIADVSERLYVFGEADWKPPRHPHMRLIHTSSDSRLSREWLIIADSPSLRVALVAEDLDGFDAPNLDARRFRAIKTSDPSIVSRLADAAEELIDSLLAA
jgi:DICT domain-containing protein